MLLISCPSTKVRSTNPSRSACGPASPLESIAVEREHPADEDHTRGTRAAAGTARATSAGGRRSRRRRRGDRDREDEKGDRESLLYVGRLVSELKTDTTVEPTPEVSD